MSRSRRLVMIVFSLLVILFLGLLFWPFILHEIITPVSLVVWVLLRIFVLSIHQQYYWVALIFVASFILYRRLVPPLDIPAPAEDFQPSNATLRTLGYWQSLFSSIDQHVQGNKILKKNLAQLLLSLYATRQHTPADFRLYDALQQGRLPLPEEMHAFLFPEGPQPAGRSLKRLVQSLGNAPRKWVRRWTGQETAEHYRMVEEILCFLESSLEMKNDDGTSNPTQH